MTLPTIGKPVATQERVTTGQALNVLGFILVVMPTAVALNVLIWNAALWLGRQ